MNMGSRSAGETTRKLQGVYYRNNLSLNLTVTDCRFVDASDHSKLYIYGNHTKVNPYSRRSKL